MDKEELLLALKSLEAEKNIKKEINSKKIWLFENFILSLQQI